MIKNMVRDVFSENITWKYKSLLKLQMMNLKARHQNKYSEKNSLLCCSTF